MQTITWQWWRDACETFASTMDRYPSLGVESAEWCADRARGLWESEQSEDYRQAGVSILDAAVTLDVMQAPLSRHLAGLLTSRDAWDAASLGERVGLLMVVDRLAAVLADDSVSVLIMDVPPYSYDDDDA